MLGEEVSTPMDEEINETPLNPDKIEESQLLHLLKENRKLERINVHIYYCIINIDIFPNRHFLIK